MNLAESLKASDLLVKVGCCSIDDVTDLTWAMLHLRPATAHVAHAMPDGPVQTHICDVLLTNICLCRHSRTR